MTATKARTIAGHAVNPIGLGCMSLSWAYGVPPSPKDGAKLLHHALDIGYNHFDTARIYGEGKNEILIGNALNGRRKEFFLASKTGIFVEGDKRRVDCRPEMIRGAIEESLRLLKTDYIDLYYLHRRDFNTPIEDSVGELARAIEAGKIGSIGLSEMSAQTLRKAAAIHPIAAMQTEYSPQTRNPEIAVLKACKDLGTTFVAFSPVGRGSLCGTLRDPSKLPNGDLRKSWPRFIGENWTTNLALIDAFGNIARDAAVTQAQLALGWVLAKGEHIVTIPGTANIAHLEENIAQHNWIPDAATLAGIDALINQQTVAGPRYPAGQQRSIDTEEFDVV